MVSGGSTGRAGHTCPHQTLAKTEAKIIKVRQTKKLGPARIAAQLGMTSTVHRVLVRHGMFRLAWMDRPTGRVIRRYEQRPAPATSSTSTSRNSAGFAPAAVGELTAVTATNIVEPEAGPGSDMATSTPRSMTTAESRGPNHPNHSEPPA